MLRLHKGEVDEHRLRYGLIRLAKHPLLEQDLALHPLLGGLSSAKLHQHVRHVTVVVQQDVLVGDNLGGCLGGHLLAALEEREGVVVLELNDPGELFHGLQYGGGDVILELLKGLIKEKYDGGELAAGEEGLDLLRARHATPGASLGAALQRVPCAGGQCPDLRRLTLVVGYVVDVLADKANVVLVRGHRGRHEVEELPGVLPGLHAGVPAGLLEQLHV
mmetsp:Transcript_1101/g.3293  ORF Transcript_1101/g.3293 Transcript_1101/m.3293 type:complete len:219 (+) Transcript_1101:3101-3757(+)